MDKKDLATIKEKLEKEWPEQSVYFFTSKGTLNNDGERAAELLSRRNGQRATQSLSPNHSFCCLVCDRCHSEDICSECGAHYTYSS